MHQDRQQPLGPHIFVIIPSNLESPVTSPGPGVVLTITQVNLCKKKIQLQFVQAVTTGDSTVTTATILVIPVTDITQAENLSVLVGGNLTAAKELGGPLRIQLDYVNGANAGRLTIELPAGTTQLEFEEFKA